MPDPQDTLLEFPCSYPLKAIGKGVDDFEDIVVTIVSRHVPDFDPAHVTSRPSNKGAYLSVTATFTAQSKAQLDALYLELNAHERVMMVF